MHNARLVACYLRTHVVWQFRGVGHECYKVKGLVACQSEYIIMSWAKCETRSTSLGLDAPRHIIVTDIFTSDTRRLLSGYIRPARSLFMVRGK